MVSSVLCRMLVSCWWLGEGPRPSLWLAAVSMVSSVLRTCAVSGLRRRGRQWPVWNLDVSCFRYVLIRVLPRPRSSAWARESQKLPGCFPDPRAPVPRALLCPVLRPWPSADGCACDFTCCASPCPGLSGKRDRGYTLGKRKASVVVF